MAEERMRPGKQRSTGQPAGLLKSGNTVNVGRLKKDVRIRLIKGADAGADFWIRVSKGNKCIPVYNANGTERTHFRYPTVDERNYAIAKCCEYGVGKNDRLETEDVTPIDKQALRQQLIRRALEQGGESEST